MYIGTVKIFGKYLAVKSHFFEFARLTLWLTLVGSIKSCSYTSTGGPRISWFHNSWSSQIRDSVSGMNFVNSLQFSDFKKEIKKFFENFLEFFLIFFYIFFSKSRNCEEFTKLRPETESRICEDHELWNHEMRGPPVLICFQYNRI